MAGECGAVAAHKNLLSSLPIALLFRETKNIELGVIDTMNPSSSSFSALKWTPEAKAKLKNIPFFVRSQARQRVEEMAYSTDAEVVTAEMVEEARQKFGN